MSADHQTSDFSRPATAERRSSGGVDAPNAFAGLRIAVTGGTSGLGLALVRELLGRDAQVAFVARRRQGVERVMREQPGAHGIVGDISKKDDIYPDSLIARK